jgi:hypothetical protein
MQQKTKHTTVAQRAEHISRWQQSGMSKQDYCKAKGINYLTFISWFKGRNPNETSPQPEARSMSLS